MSGARNVEIRFFGSTRALEEALAKAGIAADAASKEIGDKMGSAASKTGGIFSKLGSSMSNFGLPFGESVSKMGEKIGEVEGKGKRFGAAMAEVGKGLTLGLGAAALAVGAESFKLGEQWQSAMASLAGHAGIGIGAADKIGQAFLGTAGKSEFSATEIANAFAPVAGEFVNLTGHALNAGQSLTVMSAASDLATASGTPLADATKAIADVMIPFHMNVSQAAGASNTLWNTQRLLGVSTQDLQKTFERIVPYVAGSGMSFGQMSGLVVELSHSLGGGRMAMRQAGTAIQGLISPSSSANKALAAMGVQLFNTQGKFVGMGPALDKLKTGLRSLPGATGALSAEQRVLALSTELATVKGEAQTKQTKATIAGINQQLAPLKAQAAAFTQSSAMQAIFGKSANAMLGVIAGGSAGLAHYTAMASKNGAVQKAAAQQSKTWHVETKVLKATLEDLGTRIGNKLIPIAQRLAGDVMKLVQWFQKHAAVAEVLAGVIGGVVVAAIGAYAVSMATAAAATIAAAAPVLAIVAGVALLAAGIYELVTHWSQVWGEIKRVAAAAWHAVYDNVVHPIEQLFTKTIPSVFDSGIQFFAKLPGRIVKALASFGKDLVGWIKGAWRLWLHANEVEIRTVLGLFTKLPGRIVKAAASLGDHLVKWIKDGWHAFQNADRTAVQAVLKWFKGLPGDLLKAAGSLGAHLTQWAKDAWHAFQNADVDAVQAVQKWFERLPAKIIGWLGNAGKLLVNVGKQIIQGLINGVTGMVGKAVKAVKNVGKSILSGIKGLFGVFSPSRVMAEIGTNIVQGLANGIAGSGPRAVQAMTAMANQLKMSGQSTLGAAAQHLAGMMTQQLSAGLSLGGPQLGVLAGQLGPAGDVGGVGQLSQTAAVGGVPGLGAAAGSVGQGLVYQPTYNIPVTGDMSPQTAQQLKVMLEQHDQQLIAMLQQVRAA